MTWLFYFIFSFLTSLFLSGIIFWFKNKFKLSGLFRWGGLAIVSTFLFSVLLNSEIVLTSGIKFLLLSLLGVLFFGLLDDQKKFSWKTQLFFQFGLAIFLFFGGFQIEQISLPWGGVWEIHSSFLVGMFFLVWVLLIINSVNWLDGKDGLLGTLSFFGAISIFLVSLRPEVNQPALAILSLLFLGAILGFWVFNFPPAKLEAGTSGSYFVGLIFVGLSLLAGTKIMTTLLVLILPILDAIRVIWERFREGESIFSRDEKKRHLHYLLTQIGWSEKKIIGVYSFFWFLALWPEFFLKNRQAKFSWLVGEIVIIWFFFFWTKKRYKKNRS